MMESALESPLFNGSDYQFLKTQAAAQLRQLARSPLDLTDPAILTPERIDSFKVEGCGLKLLYGTQRVDEEVMKNLWHLADEAKVFEKMEALQSGEVINFIEGQQSEDRAVLHTATRDFFDRPRKEPAAAEAAAKAKVEYEKLEAFLRALDKEKQFTDLILIGIGGSELGPKMLYNALRGYQRPGRTIHFVSNVDPDDAALALNGLDLEKTLVVSVSKSGGTLETKTNEDLVRHAFKEAGLDPSQHVIAATGEGSPMDDPGRYRAIFYVWDFIGGRYCATSMIGGLVLGFAYGFDVYRDFLKGANAMDKLALCKDPAKNIPLTMALLGIWNRNFLGCPTLAVIPYSAMLHRFAAHIQQLDMESNGKRIDRQGNDADFHTGPIIWGEPATNAQHSFFQLIHQGTDAIPLEFIGFKESQCDFDLTQQGTTSQDKLLANLFAQALALATGQKNSNPNKVFPGNRPSSILLGEKLTPPMLGALLACYEHKVDFQGFIWNINSFDQEGVQLGKVLANKILDRMVSRKERKKGEPYPLGDALLDQLDQV